MRVFFFCCFLKTLKIIYIRDVYPHKFEPLREITNDSGFALSKTFYNFIENLPRFTNVHIIIIQTVMLDGRRKMVTPRDS